MEWDAAIEACAHAAHEVERACANAEGTFPLAWDHAGAEARAHVRARVVKILEGEVDDAPELFLSTVLLVAAFVVPARRPFLKGFASAAAETVTRTADKGTVGMLPTGPR